jgi:plastocyanin
VGKAPRKIVVQPTTAAAQQPVASVAITGFAFAPARLTAKIGQTINFTNNDAVAHTATSDSGAWDSGELATGASYSVTLDQAGTYAFHCAVHPFMRGTIVVD